ncbi:MAG: glycosyltransferase [Sphingobacteriia bacterium]|jgi:glycosyltransferase involved in cell wall biosynthesis
MNSTRLAISIVICTYNRANYIGEAMNSLYNQSLPKDQFEVIIVDNNSTDQTESVCNAFITTHTDSHFYYLKELKQGASFARNTGAAIANAPLLCFMDDDAVANKDYLERIISFFSTHKDAGGLGGRIIPRYIPSEPVWMSHFVSSLVGNFDYSKQITVFSPNKYPLESNMIIRKIDFDAVNGFNTALPGVKGTLRIGGEGKEFFLKLKALGRIIYYDPSVIVEHIVETEKLTSEYMYRVASGIGRGERVRTKAINEWAFIKKVIEYLYKFGGAIILAIGYLFQGNPAKMWPVIQFRIDALKGLLNH